MAVELGIRVVRTPDSRFDPADRVVRVLILLFLLLEDADPSAGALCPRCHLSGFLSMAHSTFFSFFSPEVFFRTVENIKLSGWSPPLVSENIATKRRRGTIREERGKRAM